MLDPVVVATTRGGRRLYAAPGDARAVSLAEAGGDLNPGSLRLWRHVLESSAWPLVLDVGVNYGEMLVGAPIPQGARLIGFEPNVDLHPYLQRTLDEAGLTLELRSEALADRPGSAVFAVDTVWSGTSTLASGVGPEVGPDVERWIHREVPVTTLDEVLGHEPRSFCAKIDVEGHEAEVVAGADRALSWEVPWALLLEVLHMSTTYLAGLAGRFHVLALDLRTDRLVRLPGGNGELVRELLGSGWLYPQDCIVANEAAGARLAGPAQSSGAGR